MRLNDLPPQATATAAWPALHDAASQPYRSVSPWAWHWARGKLRHDPVFRGLLERGDIPAASRVVDLGCGQGLMASLLQACADMQRAGDWPAAWPARCSAACYLGIELMPKDAARAQAALQPLPLAPRFLCADLRQAALPACDLVIILDVLHYIDHPAQAAVLGRVRAALAASAPRPGRLLLRVGDAAQTRGYGASQCVDRVVTWARGHRVAPTWGRPLQAWTLLLHELGFVVRAVPQSQGTPFANVLLVADLQGAAR